jgi:hypothetical protein
MEGGERERERECIYMFLNVQSYALHMKFKDHLLFQSEFI